MAEIIEVDELPGVKNGGNRKVGSIDDLHKIAELFEVPLILKKKKEHYLFVEELKSLFIYKG